MIRGLVMHNAERKAELFEAFLNAINEVGMNRFKESSIFLNNAEEPRALKKAA